MSQLLVGEAERRAQDVPRRVEGDRRREMGEQKRVVERMGRVLEAHGPHRRLEQLPRPLHRLGQLRAELDLGLSCVEGSSLLSWGTERTNDHHHPAAQCCMKCGRLRRGHSTGQ